MSTPLDNIMWHTLSGAHAPFSAGTDRARRYAPGFSPIIGFAEPASPDFAAIAPFCESGEHFYCAHWSGPAPAGWSIEAESTMFQMTWHGDDPAREEAADAVPLEARHAGQAVALATLTRPGPFGPRTLELGGKRKAGLSITHNSQC